MNFSDVKRRRGDIYPFATEFPYVPGSEIAGTVVAHGSGIDGPPIGTRVFALDGPFAETKEMLGGYLIITVASLDDALTWAARSPSSGTGSTEVRPVALLGSAED